jgi:Kef-type K+ transport system membrane component KefB
LFFGLSVLEALFIGGTLTATSIGIKLRVVTDLQRHNSTEGQIVLGAAVLDDILGVVLRALLYEFSIGGEINLLNAGKVLVSKVIFFVLAPIAEKLISFLIKRLHTSSAVPGLVPSTIVSLMFFLPGLHTKWVRRNCSAVSRRDLPCRCVFIVRLVPF